MHARERLASNSKEMKHGITYSCEEVEPSRWKAVRQDSRSCSRSTASRSPLLLAVIALGTAAAVTLALIYVLGRGSGAPATGTSSGLPRTSDYHSLLVAPTDPNELLLGTHQGLFESVDGGVTWRSASLAGSDAMNLARPGAGTVWAAGHDLLSRSIDGGATWHEVRPSGLPSLDVHGFVSTAARASGSPPNTPAPTSPPQTSSTTSASPSDLDRLGSTDRRGPGFRLASLALPPAFGPPPGDAAPRRYGIERTILPSWSPASRRSCAARISARGNTVSMCTRALPLRTRSKAPRKSSLVPIDDP